MIWSEFKEFMSGLPKHWDFGRHELNSLFRVAENLSMATAEQRLADFLARYEGRYKPSVKHLRYALTRDHIEQGFQGPSPVVPDDGPLLSNAQSGVVLSWAMRYLNSQTKAQRRDSVQWYMEERDRTNDALSKREFTDLSELLRQNEGPDEAAVVPVAALSVPDEEIPF